MCVCNVIKFIFNFFFHLPSTWFDLNFSPVYLTSHNSCHTRIILFLSWPLYISVSPVIQDEDVKKKRNLMTKTGTKKNRRKFSSCFFFLGCTKKNYVERIIMTWVCVCMKEILDECVAISFTSSLSPDYKIALYPLEIICLFLLLLFFAICLCQLWQLGALTFCSSCHRRLLKSGALLKNKERKEKKMAPLSGLIELRLNSIVSRTYRFQSNSRRPWPAFFMEEKGTWGFSKLNGSHFLVERMRVATLGGHCRPGCSFSQTGWWWN